MKPTVDEKEDLYTVIFAELKGIGVKLPKVKKLKSNIVKQEKCLGNGNKKSFGVALLEQEWISEAGSILPRFVASVISYLMKFVLNEGLFRKTGSVLRQKELRNRIELGGSLEGAEPNDVASLLKQWLRELPEPIIPSYLYDIFLRCQYVISEEHRINAVLLACLLLPPEHLHTLCHLLHFLSAVASQSDSNKMDAHNLAVIMAPNLLSGSNERADKASSIVQHHTSLVELLITNADHVGKVPPVIAERLQEQGVVLKNSEDMDGSYDALEDSPSKIRKKRKSGPVYELVNGIRKFVGQNRTPVGFLRDQCTPEASHLHKATVVRSASKRKADRELSPLSVAKKQAITDAQVKEGLPSQFTPVGKAAHLLTLSTTPLSVQGATSLSDASFASAALTQPRRKSFGLLKRKYRKRAKSTHPVKALIPSVENPDVHPDEIKTVERPQTEMKKPSTSLQSFSLKNDISTDVKIIGTQKLPVSQIASIQEIPNAKLLIGASQRQPIKRVMSECQCAESVEELKKSNPKTRVTSVSQSCLQVKNRQLSPHLNMSSGEKAKHTKNSFRIKCEEGNCSSRIHEIKTMTEKSVAVNQFSSQNLLSEQLGMIKSPIIRKVGSERHSSRAKYNTSTKLKKDVTTNLETATNSKQKEDCVQNSSKQNFKQMNVIATESILQCKRKNNTKRNSNKSGGSESNLNTYSKSRSVSSEKSFRKNNLLEFHSQTVVSKSKNLDHSKNGQEFGIKQKSLLNIEHENIAETTSDTSHRKSFKRRDATYKSSLRRGRPNTIKTGLPSELCPKYTTDSTMSLKAGNNSDSPNVELCLDSKLSRKGYVSDHINNISETSSVSAMETNQIQIGNSSNKMENTMLLMQNEKACHNAKKDSSLQSSPVNLNLSDGKSSKLHSSQTKSFISDISPNVSSLCTQLQSAALETDEQENSGSLQSNSDQEISLQSNCSTPKTTNEQLMLSNIYFRELPSPVIQKIDASKKSTFDSERSISLKDIKNYRRSDSGLDKTALSHLKKQRNLPKAYSNQDLKIKNKVLPKLRKCNSSINMNMSPELNPSFTNKNCQIYVRNVGEDVANSVNQLRSESKQRTLNNEKWVSGDKFLNTHLMPNEEQNKRDKRESIIQLRINNAGMVQASVQRYNHMSDIHVLCTPSRIPRGLKLSHSNSAHMSNSIVRDTYATRSLKERCSPCSYFNSTDQSTPHRRKSQHSFSSSCRNSFRISHSAPKTCNSENKENKFRKSPLPLPPKFVITDMNIISPKESCFSNVQWNTNDTVDKPSKIPRLCTRHSLSANDQNICEKKVENSKSSPKILKTENVLFPEGTFKKNQNPSSLSKSCRSESSPSLTRKLPRRSPRLRETVSTNPLPSPRAAPYFSTYSHSFSSSDILQQGSDEVTNTPTLSALCIGKFRPDEMIDEWQCDM